VSDGDMLLRQCEWSGSVWWWYAAETVWVIRQCLLVICCWDLFTRYLWVLG